MSRECFRIQKLRKAVASVERLFYSDNIDPPNWRLEGFKKSG